MSSIRDLLSKLVKARNRSAAAVNERESASGVSDSFSNLVEVWKRYGQNDPYWSVLTADAFKADNITEKSIDEFYGSGEGWIANIMDRIKAVTPDDFVLRRGKCLDFGCGVGRLAIALASRFEQVVGCDISPAHLAIGRERARAKNIKNLSLVETGQSLEPLGYGTFDMIHTVLVLQHMIPPLMESYISDFCRLLAPGGIAVFQLPTGHPYYKFDENTLEKSIKAEGMEGHCLSREEVRRVAEEGGCRIVAEEVCDCVGAGYESYLFFMIKK